VQLLLLTFVFNVSQAYLKKKMEEQCQAQQAGLLARLAQLEAAAAKPASNIGLSSGLIRH
jgi:hypothetical protein